MADRTVTATRTVTTETTPNRRNSAASFFGASGARTRRSNFHRQLPRPPNASAVARDPVDSDISTRDNGSQGSCNLAGEIITDHQTNSDTTNEIGQQFQPAINDANSINSIRYMYYGVCYIMFKLHN